LYKDLQSSVFVLQRDDFGEDLAKYRLVMELSIEFTASSYIFVER
jgi:hypothetical protein